MRRAALLAALALAGCGGGAAGRTTVQRYSVFPADTIVVSASNPVSRACRRDAGALARESAGFLAAHHTTVNIGDVTYFLLRESFADFDARRCDLALLGRALVRTLSPARRRELIGDSSRRMASMFRSALAAAGA